MLNRGGNGTEIRDSNVCSFIKWIQIMINVSTIPYSPRKLAAIMIAKRSIRNEMPALYDGMAKDDIAVSATMITIIGLTIPA